MDEKYFTYETRNTKVDDDGFEIEFIPKDEITKQETKDIDSHLIIYDGKLKGIGYKDGSIMFIGFS